MNKTETFKYVIKILGAIWVIGILFTVFSKLSKNINIISDYEKTNETSNYKEIIKRPENIDLMAEIESHNFGYIEEYIEEVKSDIFKTFDNGNKKILTDKELIDMNLDMNGVSKNLSNNIFDYQPIRIKEEKNTNLPMLSDNNVEAYIDYFYKTTGGNVNSFFNDIKTKKIITVYLKKIIFANDLKRIKNWLDKGGDVNRPINNKNVTLLMVASYFNNQPDLLKLLLKSGADKNFHDIEKRNSLIYAASNGKINNIKTLLNAEILPASDKNGINPLMYAAFNGHKAALNLLLDAGLNINTLDNNGFSALMYAVLNNQKESVEFLISKSAKINIQSNKGDTALMIAARKGYKDIIEILINSGADPNICTNDGQTALILSALNGDKEIVRKLFDSGADVSTQNNNGINALMTSVCSGHTDLIELFISKGENINTKNKFGETALIMAIRRGFAEIKTLKEVKNEFIPISKKLKFELKKDNMSNDNYKDFVKAFNNGKLDITEKKLKETVKILVVFKADINATDNYKTTALMLAKENEHPQIIKILKSAGAKE